MPAPPISPGHPHPPPPPPEPAVIKPPKKLKAADLREAHSRYGWLPFVEAIFEGTYKILLVACIWHLAYNIRDGKGRGEQPVFGLPEVIKIGAGFLAARIGVGSTTLRSVKSKNDPPPSSSGASKD